MPQSTTANRPILEKDETAKLIRLSPVYVILLTIIFVVLSFFSDAIHQAMDPAYKKQIDAERESQRQLDRALKKFDNVNQSK